VVISPCTTPKVSCSTCATGARQLVVQDAFEMTVWFSGSYASSFTPGTRVASGPVAGAEMITFCAPASRCLAASSRLVKKPVDSITTSTPSSPQGSAAGSFSANTLSSLPSTRIASSVASTSPGNGPRIESYLSRWASVPVSVMSLTPTQSMSAPFACAALNTFLPIRPKPLIPALTDIRPSFRLSGSPRTAIYQRGECPPGRRRKRRQGRRGGLSTSRCTTSTSRSSRSPYTWARCSAMTTERCLPPVQPMPIVRCDLPSLMYAGSR